MEQYSLPLHQQQRLRHLAGVLLQNLNLVGRQLRQVQVLLLAISVEHAVIQENATYVMDLEREQTITMEQVLILQ